MPEQSVLALKDLSPGAKKTVKIDDTEILLLNHDGTVLAVEAKCPHAGAPLEKGAVCNGRLVCPWHMGTFALTGNAPVGTLLEPPPLRALKTYPVRVEDDNIFASSEPLPAIREKTLDDPRTFLLIGSGAASAAAAATLRNDGFTGRIVAVDPITDEPVDRTQLSKMALTGSMPFEKIALSALHDCQAQRIHARVTSLDSSKKEALLSNGDTLHFDAALLATGGSPKRLDIPGSDLAHTLRHSEDVRKILSASETAKHVVIIGTSFIGLEAASALTQKGLHVTVVGPASAPFADKFGDEVANALKTFHESKGTRFRLGVDLLSITPTEVNVRDSKTRGPLGPIPADLVLFGVGVSPELNFEHDLPLAEKGGIAVQDDLRAADRVWVAGDIASVNGTRIEHWRLAQQHGMIAARQMLGNTPNHHSVPYFWTFHYGKRIGYLGHATEWDQIHYDGSVEALTFLAFYLKDGKVAAVLSCGRDTDTARLSELLSSEPTLEEVRHALA